MSSQSTIRWAGLCALTFAFGVLSIGCRESEQPAGPKTEKTTPEKKTSKKAVAETPKAPKVPLGLPPLPVPKDNPMTAEKIELGKLLYFDTRLSKDGTVSCATCHNPNQGWAERRPTSKGIKDQVGGRNAPTVINSAYHPAQFWDGRAASLEEQALGPIENPIEMGHDLDQCCQQLNKIPAYEKSFKAVFGTGVTKEGIAKAIAAFERTILSGNSPYDRFKAGDKKALTDVQQRGMDVFLEKGNCATCHAPPTFSNGRYYNAGVGAGNPKPDPGRKDVTKKDTDLGKFRVPHLRDIVDTGPYFHDGSAETLEAAVALMAAGGNDNPNLSPMMTGVRAAKLTEQDKKDLVDFLKALSGKYPIIEPPKLP